MSWGQLDPQMMVTLEGSTLDTVEPQHIHHILELLKPPAVLHLDMNATSASKCTNDASNSHDDGHARASAQASRRGALRLAEAGSGIPSIIARPWSRSSPNQAIPPHDSRSLPFPLPNQSLSNCSARPEAKQASYNQHQPKGKGV